MEISYYVDHPVYRYRDIEKLGRICKTEGSWTKTWPLEQLCTMCAPLVRLSSPILFPSNDPTLSRSLFISSLACHFSLFDPLPRASRSRLIRYTYGEKLEWNPRSLVLYFCSFLVTKIRGVLERNRIAALYLISSFSSSSSLFFFLFSPTHFRQTSFFFDHFFLAFGYHSIG